jgi:hypothetical protein
MKSQNLRILVMLHSPITHTLAVTLNSPKHTSLEANLSEAYFSGEFNGPTYFHHTIFEKPTKITFDIINMSKVSI